MEYNPPRDVLIGQVLQPARAPTTGSSSKLSTRIVDACCNALSCRTYMFEDGLPLRRDFQDDQFTYR